MEELKTQCMYCKVEILVATAERTNGYCMPHAHMGRPFKERISGIIVSVEEVGAGASPELTDLIKSMQSTDKLIRFRTLPSSPHQSIYAAMGYAIVRDGEWLDGIIVEWGANPEYDMDVEEILSIEEFVRQEPEILERFKPAYRKGDTLLYFRTSPASWEALRGREGFAIVRKGERVKWVYTCIN